VLITFYRQRYPHRRHRTRGAVAAPVAWRLRTRSRLTAHPFMDSSPAIRPAVTRPSTFATVFARPAERPRHVTPGKHGALPLHHLFEPLRSLARHGPEPSPNPCGPCGPLPFFGLISRQYLGHMRATAWATRRAMWPNRERNATTVRPPAWATWATSALTLWPA
jgi:hypothetical protein